MIPALLLLGIPANVQNVAPPSKNALPPTIGHPMASSIVFPVANPNTASSFQL